MESDKSRVSEWLYGSRTCCYVTSSFRLLGYTPQRFHRLDLLFKHSG